MYQLSTPKINKELILAMERCLIFDGKICDSNLPKSRKEHFFKVLGAISGAIEGQLK